MTFRFSASSATCVSVGWERARRKVWVPALALLALGLVGRESPAEETLYIDVWKGADGNQGAKHSPLKTLGEAARRINTGVGTGAVTIFVAEGIYPLQETVLIKPTRRFSTTERLTIRAESLPDDPDWIPSSMPVLLPVMPLSTSWMGRPDPFGGVAYGIQVETSHVTIQGFKVLGMPHYEFPASGQIHRVYPIAREGNALEDLEVKQCLFAGDPVALPLHCGVLARGHKVVIDHCVFHRCKIPVVFWGAEGGTAHGDAMRHCLVIDSYGCGLWTTQPGDDFEFRNNIITGCHYGWIREGGRRRYRVIDSVFAGNEHLIGSGAGPALNFRPLDSALMELTPSIPVVPDPIAVEPDPTHRRFLHPVDSALGHELGAGLFTTARVKPSRESEKEDEAVPSAKQQVKDLLESIESGDPKPAGVINPDKYIQHNLSVADGIQGFVEVLKQLAPGSAKVSTVRVFQDGEFVFAHTDYDFFGPKIGFDIFRFEDGKIVEHWDNLQEKPSEPNPSEHTMTDGPTEALGSREDRGEQEARAGLRRRRPGQRPHGAARRLLRWGPLRPAQPPDR